MEFKGTKGKWSVVFNERETWVENELWSVAIICNKPEKEKKANALLISKAPEMLEMLEKTLRVWGSEYEGSSHYKAIESLIKSATEL